MSMFETLYNDISSYIVVKPEDWRMITARLRPNVIRKKKKFIVEGEECDKMIFIRSGAIQFYYSNPKGACRITKFHFDKNWILDVERLGKNIPYDGNYETIEDTFILTLSSDDYFYLLKNCVTFSYYISHIVRQELIDTKLRLKNTLGLTAEEKYQFILENEPEVINRVSQQHIASYIGLTPETFSRIKRKKETEDAKEFTERVIAAL